MQGCKEGNHSILLRKKETTHGRDGVTSLEMRLIRAVKTLPWLQNRFHRKKKPLCRQLRCARTISSCHLQFLSLQREDFSLQNASLTLSLLHIHRSSKKRDDLAVRGSVAGRCRCAPCASSEVVPSRWHKCLRRFHRCSRQRGPALRCPASRTKNSEPEICSKILYLDR